VLVSEIALEASGIEANSVRTALIIVDCQDLNDLHSLETNAYLDMFSDAKINKLSTELRCVIHLAQREIVCDARY
jgi:hypothetical protein